MMPNFTSGQKYGNQTENLVFIYFPHGRTVTETGLRGKKTDVI